MQGNIQLGENCSVQYNTLMVGYGDPGDTEGLIKIGNNVRIAPNVMIISANHVFDNTDIPICKQGMDVKPITIEDDVWVAGRVNIMAGVTIGKGSVIGAGSIVTKDIPPYSVAVGVPAKVIKYRFSEEMISELLKVDYSKLTKEKVDANASTFLRVSSSAVSISSFTMQTFFPATDFSVL